MPLYFAYGVNMDVGVMAARCPRSKPLGPARLMRHRLAAMREGWLTVARDPRATVQGVLWTLALADVPALDRFEGIGERLYVKVVQPVVAAAGPKRALLYVGANAGPGRLKADYAASVLAAARAWQLPREGIATLERLAAEAGVADAATGEKPVVRPLFRSPLER